MTAYWVIDMDGVMWRGSVPVQGSAEAVAELLDRGDTVLFCTNNSGISGSERARQLVARGLPEGIEVVTSADAAASMLGVDDRVLAVGGPGLVDTLDRAVASAVPVASAAAAGDDGGGYDVVVVGIDLDFDYERLAVASKAVRRGARLVATNADATYPGPDGLRPGAGSIVAAVEVASGARAEVAGKPHAPMVEIIGRLLGADATAADAMVVGDRIDTDGALAERLGWPFALVLSGVTAEVPSANTVPIAQVSPSLSDLVTSTDR